MTDFKDYEVSVFREKMLLHYFLSDIYQYFWLTGNYSLEVLHSEVDSFGYDIVISANGKTRHIQLKGLKSGGSTSYFNINKRLAKKEGGCVIIQEFAEGESNIEVKYYYLNFEATDLNAAGIKNERKEIKKVKKK